MEDSQLLALCKGNEEIAKRLKAGLNYDGPLCQDNFLTSFSEFIFLHIQGHKNLLILCAISRQIHVFYQYIVAI